MPFARYSLALTLSFLGSVAVAQASRDSIPAIARARYDTAYHAWQRGEYPAALAGFERILTSPDGDRMLERIALVTGELYRTISVAPDGQAPRWSADGRYASFTTNGGRVTTVVALEGDSVRNVASVPGVSLVFSPVGDRVAYLDIEETRELRAARSLADSLMRAQEFGRFQRQRQEVTRIEQEAARIVVRDLRSGATEELRAPDFAKRGLVFAPDGSSLYFVGGPTSDRARTDIYALSGSAPPRAVSSGPGIKSNAVFAGGGTHLVYVLGSDSVAIREIASGAVRTFAGTAPAVSADGSTIAFLSRAGSEFTIIAVAPSGGEPTIVKRSARPLATPVPSPDGRRIAHVVMLRDDWDLFVVGRDGQGDTRLSREIQHDVLPRWLSKNRVLAIKGEPRHRRSYMYDAATGEATRLHHNNTVRTVAPEYDWAVSPDGTKILIVADRDGDTISPERGVFLLDLDRTYSRGDVLARLRTAAAAERGLRTRGRRMFAAIDGPVRAAVRDISVERIYEYERSLYQFGSKYITQPGNRLAIDYIANTLRSFGYEPEIQWFEPEPGVRTANVIATLRGRISPELIYVISSHFDSVEDGPGADDNTSGTTALLEVARVLARRPQAATIKLAWFTGEEAGLYGSREFVRRAVANGDKIAGALNNDMIGWTNDERLDNTIRYSNAGIRDLQHAAAFLFTDLITYDAKYYRNTDAHAYYEVYGDIVGGIGSYPILGNPHYHQSHDILETINHRLVTEVSKTTAASIMLLASSPARPTGLEVVRREGDRVEIRWTAAPERDHARYSVTIDPPGAGVVRTLTVTTPRATLTAVAPGSEIAVRAVNTRGLESWDAARITVPTSGSIEWTSYGRDPGGSRYAPIADISRNNVAQLRVAWTYRTRETDSAFATRRETSLEATPLVVDGTLYFATPLGRVIALDPATGAERWVFDPQVDRRTNFGDFTNRGVTTWLDPSADANAPCGRRIFVAVIDARLIALDSRSGRPCAGFGTNGTVDLRTGLRNPPFETAEYEVTSPPAIVRGILVVGSAVADNNRTDAASGEVRGFDARTGALRWTWDPVPQKATDPAYPTWVGDRAHTTGAANAWSVIAADTARGLVFVPTGSPSPDYYGGARLGDNRYANSIVALRAATGDVVWHFQTVHHDLWDYDNASPPALTTVRVGGREIDVVVQATKTGMLYVLDRMTGVPVFPVEERAVPRSTVPGEESSRTQPFTVRTPPLSPHTFRREDVWGATAADRDACLEAIAPLRNEGIFTPPSLEGTLVNPSNIGGAHWGGVAIDPSRQLAVVPVNRLVAMVQLIPAEALNTDSMRVASQRFGFEYTRMRGTPFVMRRRIIRAPSGLPCSPPPFGTLVAVRLTTGERAWEVPLGTITGLAPAGATVPASWGSPTLGGPITTAGGLVFIAATLDRSIRAFDVETGRELWRGELPASGKATPMTYRVNGKQYVVVSAGGGGVWGRGDWVVAFALP